jgi:hypothetical protein
MTLDYPDACPACLPGDAPAALSVGTPEPVPAGIITAHQCAACGTAWETFWREGWPVERLIAPVSAEQAEQHRVALEGALRHPRSAA